MDNIKIQKTPSSENTEYETPEESAKILSNDNLQAQNNLLNQKLDLRKQYANRSFWVAVSWTAFSIILTIFQFIKLDGMQLHKAEFIAIVATALASIISLYLQVGKSIYKDL